MSCPLYRPLFLRNGLRLVAYNPFSIILIEADDNYATVITTSGKQCIRCTMKEIEDKIVYDFFCRVHRSFIININYVKYIEKGLINLDKVDAPLQKDYAAAFFSKLLIL